MPYTMRILEVDGGEPHELPADTVTRDEDGGGGPLLPLGFRGRSDVFYVRCDRWPQLAGKALQLGAPPRRR